MKKKWVNSFSFSLLLTFTVLFIYSFDFQFFELLELKSYDLEVRARGKRPISGQVVIVAIDEKSLAKEGRWPWPRTKLAQLVDRLSEAGTAVIGFDILFPEKDIYVPFSTIKDELKKKDLTNIDREGLTRWLDEVGDSDKHFAKSLENSNRSVLGYFVYPDEESAEGSAEKLNDSHLELLDFSQYSVVQRTDSPENPAPLRSIYSVGMSIHSLMNAANSAGFVTFVPEADGVVRRVPLVLSHGEFFFPPLSLQMLQQATRLPIATRIAPYGIDGIRLGESVIPTSEKGDFLINYYGPAFTFTHYSAADVLSKKIGAKELEGKIVLIGATAAGIHDIHTSPFGPLFPGVEVHANVMESIIQSDYLMRPEWLRVLDIALIIAFGIIFGVASKYYKAYAMAVFLALGVSIYMGIDYYLFTKEGVWIHTIYPIFSQVFIYSGVTLFKFIFEERERRFIKGAFSQYLAPAVVERLVENPNLLKLGGERKVLTAFFSDVAGFSTISEKLNPDELVDLLNDYLTEMTDIIMKYEGTVDKFEGDAIIAFFGAPIYYDDHPKRCCYVALEMQERLDQLRAMWREEGKHELFMRIGINTGNMVVGNMGSKSRMDYTMMGDSVNLAARLEGVNKQYKTYTMISEFTYDVTKDDIEARELDLIRVVGKSQPVRIYELLGKKGEMDENIRAILPHFTQGLEHYKNRCWEESISCFEKALGIYQDDGPSLIYFERCMAFQGRPPADDWDGVFSMTSK